MIKSIKFHNFKGLRDAYLPLNQFTLIVGPNGSGKSTALQPFSCYGQFGNCQFNNLISAGAIEQNVDVFIEWDGQFAGQTTHIRWMPGGCSTRVSSANNSEMNNALFALLQATRAYSLDSVAIAGPVQLQQHMELSPNGSQLAGVLDRLRDNEPERFQELNNELSRWLPEFDQILFETPQSGFRAIKLRTRKEHHHIQAANLSQGTLIALAILTISYLPSPPSLVCFEEPDRGIHPRLLKDIKEALYRLSYPKDFGELRAPVQVIATTHSPYFLDLYRDHPDEIVISEKKGDSGSFEALSNRTDLDEILKDANLGDVWYSGVLGGVPAIS